MPGVLDHDSDNDSPQVDNVLPSKLVGPRLNVDTIYALDMLRDAYEHYEEKLAVASMYQPANYLSEIFESPSSLPMPDGASPAYLRWSFGQLRRAGDLLAAALATRGVREGMAIAGFVRGSIQFYMLLHAALVLRCRFSPMNSQSTANANEVRHMLDVVKPNVVVTYEGDILNKLEAAVPDLTANLLLKVVLDKPSVQDKTSAPATAFEYFEDLVLSALPFTDAQSKLERFEDVHTSPDDDVVVLFTSGTSALPKGCPLTNRNLCSIATNFANGPTGGTSAVVNNHLPIYHIAGGISAGWNPLCSGAAVVHPGPSFTAKSTIDAMRIEGVTFQILVPSMIGLIMNDPDLPPAGELSIKSCSLGASTILYTDVEKCYEYLGARRVITSYGMTEGLMMTRGHLPRKVTKEALNGIQQICAGARIKICEPNSTKIVPRGEPGEVHQGGATTIRGYIGTETKAFYEDEDGLWCMTGDQAIMHPDGGIQITGRYKDLVIRGGVNISPQAIEGVIAKILGLEAHVVGMPDSIAGEVPVAIVRDADVDKASLSKLREPIVRELGPRFALEKFIGLKELGLEDFPRTSTGKIRKVDLQGLVKQYARDQATNPQEGGGDSGKPTIERLMDTWSDVAGVDREQVTAETSVLDLADSLMLARFAVVIRESFKRPFSLQDLNKYPTLGAQAELLDSRAEADSHNSDLVDEREGPPQAADIVHVEEDEDRALHTRKQVEKVINPMGFEWEDVQDVFTPSQWLQSWVKSRETSDRFRAAYVSTEADVKTFRAAVEETLLRNDSLRAISIPFGDSTDIQAILRHNEKWLSKVITMHDKSVAKVADLERLIPGDKKLQNGLVQVIIAHCEETNSAGACLMTLHTTFDAFSLDTMRKDLNLILNEMQPKQHVPYKLWADHLYNQRDSAQSKAAIAYNVRRLQGLSTKKASLWPPQRTEVWQRGCDRGLHVTVSGDMTTADDPKQRKLLDGSPETCFGSAGLRRERALQDIETLTSQHRLPPPIIVKAALSLLETRLTGQSTALFSQTFAMRDNWPFIDQWISRRLPSPLEVTGPTLSRIAEIIPINREENVMDWLQRMKVEQEELVKHAHAPYREVFDELNRRSDKSAASTNGRSSPTSSVHSAWNAAMSIFTGGNDDSNGTFFGGYSDTNGHTNGTTESYLPASRDGDVMESIRKRINLQWLPIFGRDKRIEQQVRFVSNSHFNEVGLAVKSGMLADHKTIWVKMEWDDGNIRSSEAKAWIEEMIGYIEMLGKEETWSKKVGDLC